MTKTTRRGAGHPQRRGAAPEHLRRHNLSAVVERLHLAGPLSRSELASTTELNRSTVADLIGELGELGLAEERPGPATSGPGRPSTLVRTRPQGAVVLAIDLAVDHVSIATIGIGGHFYNRLRVERVPGGFTPEQTVDNLARLAEPLLQALPADHRLVGAGVAVAGVTRRADGFVHLSPNLGWTDVPLGAMIEQRLCLDQPVLVSNEADLGALAEYRRGSHQGTAHLIYVSGEVGIGCGVIVGGVPMLGAEGYAGEAGHTVINPVGHHCRCGARGCWETEAGELALLRHIGLKSETGHIDEVVDLARAGDVATLEAIAEVGRWLGVGIGNLVNVFNPDVVVLGGLYARLFPHFQPAVADTLEATALAAPRTRMQLDRTALGQDVALVGAAELVLSATLTDPAGTIGSRLTTRAEP